MDSPKPKGTMNRRDLIKTALTTGISFSAGTVIAHENLKASGSSGSKRYRVKTPSAHISEFEQEAARIYERHWQQSVETVSALKKKYEQPAFGEVKVWDLIPQLAHCIDATDKKLCNTSQFVHVQQIVWQMEKDRVEDQDMYLAALLHDLGKVILLNGEEPENVMCGIRPIGEYEPGCGLENIVFQWNHDEFIYSRLKDHLPEHLAWLLRFHSVDIEGIKPFCSPRDLEYVEAYLIPFRRYDSGTKSTHIVPPLDLLAKYEGLIEEYFPRPIRF